MNFITSTYNSPHLLLAAYCRGKQWVVQLAVTYCGHHRPPQSLCLLRIVAVIIGLSSITSHFTGPRVCCVLMQQSLGFLHHPRLLRIDAVIGRFPITFQSLVCCVLMRQSSLLIHFPFHSSSLCVVFDVLQSHKPLVCCVLMQQMLVLPHLDSRCGTFR